MESNLSELQRTLALLSKLQRGFESAAAAQTSGDCLLGVSRADVLTVAGYLRQFGLAPDADRLVLASLEFFNRATDEMLVGMATNQSPEYIAWLAETFGSFPDEEDSSERFDALRGKAALLANRLAELAAHIDKEQYATGQRATDLLTTEKLAMLAGVGKNRLLNVFSAARAASETDLPSPAVRGSGSRSDQYSYAVIRPFLQRNWPKLDEIGCFPESFDDVKRILMAKSEST